MRTCTITPLLMAVFLATKGAVIPCLFTPRPSPCFQPIFSIMRAANDFFAGSMYEGSVGGAGGTGGATGAAGESAKATPESEDPVKYSANQLRFVRELTHSSHPDSCQGRNTPPALVTHTQLSRSSLLFQNFIRTAPSKEARRKIRKAGDYSRLLSVFKRTREWEGPTTWRTPVLRNGTLLTASLLTESGSARRWRLLEGGVLHGTLGCNIREEPPCQIN